MNKGTNVSTDINISISEKNNISGIEYEKNKNIESLDPSENKEIIIPITSSSTLQGGEASFNIKISEGHGFIVDPINLTFYTLSLFD